MLVHQPDIDAHLEYVENLDGYLFKVTGRQISNFQLKSIFDRVEKTIVDGDKDHTVLIIEEPPHRWERSTSDAIKRLGAKVDGKKTHQIHAFFIPSPLFAKMVEEITDWD